MLSTAVGCDRQRTSANRSEASAVALTQARLEAHDIIPPAACGGAGSQRRIAEFWTKDERLRSVACEGMPCTPVALLERLSFSDALLRESPRVAGCFTLLGDSPHLASVLFRLGATEPEPLLVYEGYSLALDRMGTGGGLRDLVGLQEESATDWWEERFVWDRTSYRVTGRRRVEPGVK